MPLAEGTTVKEAREIISHFLSDTGCYAICAKCTTYPGGEGCCYGCPQLKRSVSGEITGCGNQNLSCLSYACNTLAIHLSKIPSPSSGNKLMEFLEMTYGVQREGYRGSDRKEDNSPLQMEDPLGILREEEK